MILTSISLINPEQGTSVDSLLDSCDLPRIYSTHTCTCIAINQAFNVALHMHIDGLTS